MGDSWLRDLRDAGDILRHARGPKELAKALVPNAWLAREVLNDEPPGTDAVSDPTQGARALRELGNRLKGEAIRDDGLVDYAKLRDSATFALLQRTSRTLHLVDPVRLESDEERIAFWTNLYNVLAIHGVVALDVQASVMELPSFFGVVAYRVGDYVVTLDEIENGILRRNAPHPIRREALLKTTTRDSTCARATSTRAFTQPSYAPRRAVPPSLSTTRSDSTNNSMQPRTTTSRRTWRSTTMRR